MRTSRFGVAFARGAEFTCVERLGVPHSLVCIAISQRWLRHRDRP
jgi:hypothetical protein